MCRKRKNKHKKGGNHVTVAGSLIDGSSILKPLAVILPLNDSNQSEMPSALTSSDSKGNKVPMKTFNISNYDKNLLDHDRVFKSVHEFCEYHIEQPEKRRPIERILVATNGIAAVRCMLSIRRVLQHMFNNDRAVKFICITTEQEILSNAEYLKLADHYVTSPGGENRNNYANVDEIVSHAIEQKVDAVWAGWGHASENPELPRQLRKNGIVFIGPSAEAMASLGDKIASTIIAQSVRIPTIEWSGSGLTLEACDNAQPGTEISVSKELFHKACVSSVNEGLDAMSKHKIGYPMMIKASEGGGGKGIRKCMNETDFKENFLQVQTEVPGSPIFLMKCLENARHIEVQLIADRYGCVIPIFTRDCSIQRRCQKIIEEAPASIAPKATLKKMQEDAVKIAELVGYESAGTVEYMYLPKEDTYFFLELNPRLQVEHPCTEMLTNVNIPAMQLQIAMGLPLNRITDVRLFYGMKRYGTDPLPEERVRTDTEYSVIAARITSEDPDDFFRPSTGQVMELNFRSAQNVWGYFSVASSSKVHEFADSQFGHLFARGRTRQEAISTMLSALKELELRATFTSQVMYLVDLLNLDDFKQNNFNTQWLDRRIADKVRQRIPIPDHELIALSSAVIGQNRVTSAFNNFRNAIERGQVLPTKDLTETFLFDLIKDMKIYKVQVTRSGPLTFIIYLNGATTTVNIRQMGDNDNALLVSFNSKTYRCHLEETSDKFKVMIGRSIVTFEKDNDPTILKSPYTGRLLSYKKKDKDLVKVGEVYASVESMKLVFNVEVKKVPGRLEHIAKEGDLLYPGSVIARIIEQKSTEDYRPKPFTDIFNEWSEMQEDNSEQTEIKRFQAAYERCINFLNGSVPPGMENKTAALVNELFELFECRELPHAMLKKAMDQMLTRLPEKVAQELRAVARIEDYTKFARVRDVLDNYMQNLRANEYEAARAICKSVYEVSEKFLGGPVSHMVQTVNTLLDEYFNCEEFFETDQYTDAVDLLNAKHGSDKDKVVALIYSHTQLKAKNKFMLSLLDAVEKKGMHLVAPLEKRLRDIGNLFKTESVSKRCRHLMLLNSTVKYRKFVNKVLWDLDCVSLPDREKIDVLSVGDAIAQLKQKFGQKLQEKKDASPQKIFDLSPWSHKVIHEFFFDPLLAEAAIHAYISQHFAIETMHRSQLASNDATVYNFSLDNSNLMHYMSSENNQYLSIVKFSVNFDDFHEAVTHKDIISGLVDKFKKMGVKSNGKKSTLRVTFLVDVIDFQEEERRAEEELALQSRQSSSHREALLEELPIHSQRDAHLVDSAERAAKDIRSLISNSLEAVDVVTHVLVCNKNKPLMQVDLLGAEKLELWRLPAEARLESDKLSSLHVYQTDDLADPRFSRIYVREIVEVAIRPETVDHLGEIRKDIINQMDRACGAINVHMSRKVEKTKNAVFVGNHLLFSVTFPKMPSSFTKDNEQDLDQIMIESIEEMRPILFKHHVTEVEVVYSKIDKTRTSAMKRRVKYQDKTGVTPEFGIYDEHQKDIKPVALSHQLYERQLEEHHPIKKIEKKRSVTRGIRTSYVYDYPMLFGKACLQRWKELEEANQTLFDTQFTKMRDDQKEAFEKSDYRRFFHEAELVYVPGQSELRLVEDERELKKRADNCNNETGVVAWKMSLYTPEKPHGYTVIVIANDITFQSGSFATHEDDVYSMASEYSRKHKLPRVNVSSNSGARIGLAEDVSKLFRVKFRDQAKPEDGFEYLYLDKKDAEPILDQIEAERLPNDTYKLNAVVGRKTEMIGVENLQGSGLIAGETSAAYDEVPTYCFVTGRSVGIGAYTARLAHRIVQAKSSHIILTGTGALNAVLGKEVYTSNNQLGGTQIMYNNGVTHSVCDNDFEGVSILVLWMSYLPDVKPEFPYLSPFGVDSEPRPVTFPVLPNKPYDVRDLIDSKNSEFDGICDNNSFNEIMNDWAKTIIAGRARLCGVPIGVVSSELRNVCSTLPADPATPNSQAIEVHQAGQVWYPDSAFKTAEVINDFNREGMPLLFIASLRGFSGGQKDMFDMVLKFGAQIVDALRQYKQPVLIYIPTYGELRGGAWAVLDSKINPGFITMIADSDSRGGILEPSAIVGIKFRADKLLALQKRNDSEMARLDDLLKAEVDKKGPMAVQLQSKMAKRSEELKKAYRGVTVEFADLHDRPERMKIREAVQHVVALRNSRNLFYEIVRVEMAKVQIAKRFLSVSERDSTWQTAMSWVNARLQEYRACATPKEQFDVLESAVTSHEVDAWLRKVHEQSVDKELEEMGEKELLHLQSKIAALVTKRKISL